MIHSVLRDLSVDGSTQEANSLFTYRTLSKWIDLHTSGLSLYESFSQTYLSEIAPAHIGHGSSVT